MEGMHGPKEPSVGPPLGVAPPSPGDLEPRVYVNKEMGSANQILLVLVPGALLYPKDYTCLAESLMSSAQASKGVNLSIAMAAVNWSTASFTDPQSLFSAFDSSIDRSIEKAVTEHGVQLMKSPFGRYTNVIVALHSLSSVCARGFPLLKSAGLVLLGTDLITTEDFWASINSFPKPALSIYGELDGQEHLVKAAFAIENGLIGMSTRGALASASHKSFAIIKGMNHAHFSNNIVNVNRGDIHSETSQQETVHAAAELIVHFIKASMHLDFIGEDDLLKSKQALMNASISAATLVSPYLETCGRLYPMEPFASRDEDGEGDGEDLSLSALRYSFGAEMLPSNSQVKSFMAHPGELAEAESFAKHAQKYLLQALHSHDASILGNIRLSATVHTSRKSFMYSHCIFERCYEEEGYKLGVHVQCLVHRDAYSSGYNPVAMVSPVYCLKLKSAKQIALVLKEIGVDIDPETVGEEIMPCSLNQSTFDHALRRTIPEFRTRYVSHGSKLELVDEKLSTPPAWSASQPLLERGAAESRLICHMVDGDNLSNALASTFCSEVAGCRYIQCPSTAWFMEYLMVDCLRPCTD